jgi:hypothetical protein
VRSGELVEEEDRGADADNLVVEPHAVTGLGGVRPIAVGSGVMQAGASLSPHADSRREQVTRDLVDRSTTGERHREVEFVV